jgi:imidazolonepropionase-like amidohydrolase
MASVETFIRVGTLLDGKGGPPARDVTIRVKDGKIAEVGAKTSGQEPVDLGAYTVTPGFIDCHAHLTLLVDKGWESHPVTKTAADEAIRGVHSAKATLEAGFTTVRNVASGLLDIALRNAIEAGLVPAHALFHGRDRRRTR